MRRILTAAMLAGLSPLPSQADPGLVATMTERFAASSFEFQRSRSNVAFLPLAFLSGTAYSDVEVERPDGSTARYDTTRFSQMAVAPWLLGDRDAVMVGEYLSWSKIELDDAAEDEFEIYSVGLPLGWLRQVNDDWQLSAFVMPLGHKSTLDGSDWSVEYLTGSIARYYQRDDLWWAFGIYADFGPDEDYVIPYLGASWSINERWTLSAVMPWPALIYAPTPNWMFRLGASPSGASWSLDTDSGDTHVNMDAWDFGLSAEYRLSRNIWLGARAGASGLRGLRLFEDELEEPEFDFSNNGYIGFTLNLRPALPSGL